MLIKVNKNYNVSFVVVSFEEDGYLTLSKELSLEEAIQFKEYEENKISGNSSIEILCKIQTQKDK